MAKTRSNPSGAGSAPSALPWWLTGTDEECAHCGAGYSYEAEIRCLDCDGPMCWFCVAWSQGQGRCPECTGDGGT